MIGFEDAMKSLNHLVSKNLSPYSCYESSDICLAKLNTLLAQLNYDAGYFNLGKIFYKCGYFACNYTEAYKLFSLVQHNGEALYYLGYMNEIGAGVEKNFSKAKIMYQEIMTKAINEELEIEHYFPALLSLISVYISEFIHQIYNWWTNLSI